MILSINLHKIFMLTMSKGYTNASLYPPRSCLYPVSLTQPAHPITASQCTTSGLRKGAMEVDV